MSTLKRALERARADYLARRYPGDLAADVLPAPRHSSRRVLVGGAVAAVMIVGISLLNRPAEEQVTPSPRPTSLASVPRTPAFPGMPTVPPGVQLAPAGGPIVPPAFSSLRHDISRDDRSAPPPSPFQSEAL